jgi:hypothetical protein
MAAFSLLRRAGSDEALQGLAIQFESFFQQFLRLDNLMVLLDLIDGLQMGV